MRNRFVRKALVKSTARRLASEALDQIEITSSDLDHEDCLTAEERVAVFKEIRSLSAQLHLESMEWDKLV